MIFLLTVLSVAPLKTPYPPNQGLKQLFTYR